MTYTIRDNKGNMICSIENVDPIKSEETLSDGAVFGIGAASIIGALVLVKTIKSKIDKNRIKKDVKVVIDKYGKDKLTKVGEYIYKACNEAQSVIFGTIYKYFKQHFSNLNVYDRDTDDGYAMPLEEKDIAKSILNDKLRNLSVNSYSYPIVSIKDITISNEREYEDLENKLEILCKKSLSGNIKINDFKANITNINSNIEESNYLNENKEFITKFNVTFNIVFDNNVFGLN